MTKKSKFLKDLKLSFEKFNFYDYDTIISKYDLLIDEYLKQGKNISDIIKEFDSPEELAYLEIEKCNKKIRNQNIKNIISNKLNTFIKYIKVKLKKLKKNKNLKKLGLKININNKRCNIIVLIITEVLLCLILFYFSVLFSASMYALLDHVKIYGIVIIFLSFVLLILYLLIILDKYRKEMKQFKYNFYIFLSIIIFIAIGFGVTAYGYCKLDFVNDVTEKYSMEVKINKYRLPSNNKQLNLYFNSWYKPNYIVVYNNELDNYIEVEVKYYEVFYDLNIKNETGSIYLSLVNDTRDKISMYLDNLKNNAIYNEKELSRYVVKIYVNEEYKDKLVIYD